MTQQDLFEQRPFVPEPADFERWTGHRLKIFNILKDGKWHTRKELEEKSGSVQVASRVSGLRKAGYDIECDRTNELGDTAYKILSFVGVSTTNPKHCDTCTCGVTS